MTTKQLDEIEQKTGTAHRQKAEYKSALRSKKLIRQAFVALIQEKPFDKITVTDVVQRADINRGTFYAHFKDIREIGQEIQDEIIDRIRSLLKELEFERFLENPKPLLMQISSWLQEDLVFYKSLIQVRGAEHFIVNLKDIFVSLILTDTDIPKEIKEAPQFLVHAHFHAGGIISLYQAWITGAVDNTLEEIADEISMLLSSYPKLDQRMKCL